MFSPVIEPLYEGAFFSRYSDVLLRQGGFARVPLLMGLTSNEMAGFGLVPGESEGSMQLVWFTKFYKTVF